MKLDPKRAKIDENRSNPMVVAWEYPDCPIKEICFYMAVGFGSIMKKCVYFNEHGEEADCLQDLPDGLFHGPGLKPDAG